MNMRLWSLFLAVGALSGSAVAVGAAEVNERTTYFTVRGSTLEELDRELNRKGPLIRATGVRHPGSTLVQFGGRVTYQEGAGATCTVRDTALKLELVKTLPKWTPPKAASPQTRIIWTTLSDDIKRHEEDHARIAKLWLKKLESAVRNLRAETGCEAMEAKVNAVSIAYLERHERAQREFDTIEGREMNLRLKRLLRRNVRDALTD